MPETSGPETSGPDHRTGDTTPAPPLFGVLVLAGLVIAAAGLKSVSSIVGPVFLVLTLVITVQPLTTWLVCHRVPQALASIVGLVSVYALLIIVLGSVVWSLARLVTTLTDYSDEFTALYNQALDTVNGYGLSTSTLTDALSSVNLSTFAGLAQTLLNGLTSGLSLLALMLAMVFFLVFDAADINTRIAQIRRDRPPVADAFASFAHSVRSYWVVTTIFGLIVAILDVAALAIIGVPLAFTWGVLAFVTNYIPNIGFVLGLIPPALIALLDGGTGPAIAVVVVYLLGALGALLAVPATMLVKSLLIDHSRTGRWIGALINTTTTTSKNEKSHGSTKEAESAPQ